MSLGKTDITGNVLVLGEGWVEVPEGFKVVKYGAVKEGDYERVEGEWVEVEGQVGRKAVSGTFMRRI